MERKHRKRMGNMILYLLSSAMILSAVPEMSLQAEQARETESETELSMEELYEIDGGDAEYWKYYDAQGNRIISQEIPVTRAGINNSESSDSGLKSPYNGNTYAVSDEYKIVHAIDVSKYNNQNCENENTDLDWDQVKANGVDAVIIRCGNRGYGTGGTMMTDPYFEENMEGALAAGLKVGIYIYSQAITSDEAVEEAEHCLTLCEDYLDQLDLPIVMDVEYAEPGGQLGGRLYNAGLTKAQQTELCLDFCRTIEDAGYQAMIYANKSMLTDDMNASEITDAGYQIWLARYNSSAGYTASPYVMWQYASNGSVSGIAGKVDVNFLYSAAMMDEAPVWNTVSWSRGENVRLSWQAVPGAEGYEIQRSEDSSNWSDAAWLQGSATICFTDEAADQDRTLYYRIRTWYTEDGNRKNGSWSDVLTVQMKPETPELVKLTAPDYKSLKLSWKTASNVDGFRIYRKIKGGSWSCIENNFTGTVYTDKTVDTGTTYYYTVRSYYLRDGKQILSDYDRNGLSGKAMLATPSMKSAASSAYNKIKVTWGAVDGAEGYRVYRKVSGGSWSVVADDLTDTSWTDSKAVTGTTYYYTARVFRIIKENKVLSGHESPGVSGKAVPSAPKLGKVSSVNYKKLKVTWSGVSGAGGYRIYRKTGDEGWKYLADVGSDVRSYTDEYKITCGKEYAYTVRAYRTVDGTRIYGKYDSKGISGKAIPSTPSVTLKSTEKGKVTISWNKISGANGYAVYRKNASSGNWTRIKTITSGSTVSYTTGADSGKTYYYTVRAYRTVNGSNVYSKYKDGISIKVK